MKMNVLPADANNIVIRPSRKDPESRFILPAGQDTALAVPMEPPMTDAQRRAILIGIGELFLWGTIEYENGLDTKRHTTFRFRRNRDTHEMHPCAEGNSASQDNHQPTKG